jgi:hypothetical protein
MTTQKEMNNNKGTWTTKDRKARIEAMKDYLKENKKVLRKDIYKFMLTNFYLSTRIIDEYIHNLEITGAIEIKPFDWQKEIGHVPEDQRQMTENQVIIWRGDGD